jgi:hypothetical protein
MRVKWLMEKFPSGCAQATDEPRNMMAVNSTDGASLVQTENQLQFVMTLP